LKFREYLAGINTQNGDIPVIGSLASVGVGKKQFFFDLRRLVLYNSHIKEID